MPTVLHVSEAAGTGVLRHLCDLTGATPGIDHHAVLPQRRAGSRSGAAYDHRSVEQMERAGVAMHVVDMRRSASAPRNLLAAARVRALVHRVRPDVVHGHSSVGGAVARLAAAGTGVPVVYTPHAMASRRGYLAIERALAPLSSRVVAVSESEADRAVAARLAAPGKLAVIPNGIHLADPGPGPDLRAELGLPPGTPLVGTVARLVAQKAPEAFVAVCKKVAARDPSVHFLLVGMGPLQERLDRAVGRGELSRRWHQIPHLDHAAAVLAQLDVFVLGSRFEGGPYTPLEAMRAGTPVVLSDVVGNRDVVEDGVSGFLLPFGDAAGMADATARLLCDAELRRRVTSAARARLEARFDVAVMGARLSRLYEELALASRRSTLRLPQAIAGSSLHIPEATASQ